MKKQTKSILFRLISSFMCLIAMALCVYLFILCMLEDDEETYLWFHMISLGAAFVMALLEMTICLKNMKKELLLEYIVFNENKSINLVGLVIVSIMTALSLGLSIMAIVFMVMNYSIDAYYASVVILGCCVYLFVNCPLYYLYILLFKPKKFTVEDYHKIQDTKIKNTKK